MEISERAKLATKIEKIVDNHGWNGLLDGISALVDEYYEGDTSLIVGVKHGLSQIRLALSAHCPDAPGSRTGSTGDA